MVSISDDNTKMGRVPSVSLPPIRACVNCELCKNDCYALKVYRMYKNTRAAYNRNYDMYQSMPLDYFRGVADYLSKKQPKFFRWHVSGDIPDQAYLRGMIRIAEEFDNITFLAFTKNYRLDFRRVPKNLTIIFSMWPGMKKPVKKTGVSGFAWMQDGTEKRVPKSALHCPGNCETCGMCFQIDSVGGNVVFDKH